MKDEQQEKSASRDAGVENKITITFLINGDPTAVSANVHQPLHVARDKALRDSGNIARPFDEWEVRTKEGKLLLPEQQLVALGIAHDVTLYLQLGAGAGG